MKFKTIEEAQEAYDKLKNDSSEKIKSLETEVSSHKKEVAKLNKRAEDAEAAALDAIEKVNSSANSDDVTVTVDKKKYLINFGVEGLSKDELKENTDLLKKMIKNGSAALTLLD